MKSIWKDLLRLCIIIAVLCTFVYFMGTPGFEGKHDILYGVVGGGITAFIVMFIIKRIQSSKKQK